MAELLKVDGLKGEDKWFAELGTLWPGQAFCLQYTEVLFHQRSKYQDVLILKTEHYGTVRSPATAVSVLSRRFFFIRRSWCWME
jgi:spermidine synthase